MHPSNSIIIISLCVSFSLGRKPPSYIDLCHQADPKIEQCLMNAAEQIRPHMTKGISEFAIPPLNPLVFPIAELEAGSGFKASFKNIKVYDLDKFEIEKLTMDIPKNHADFIVNFKTIRLEAMYELDGTILVLRLKGSGPATLNFTNAVVHVTLDGSRLTKEGKEYLKWDKKDYNFDLGKPAFQFDNLFGDNQDLNERTNKAINDNGEAFIQELQPIIDQSVSKVILTIFDKVFARYALKELFL